jgi:4'-phosphopantetheinyl transferase
MERLPRPGEVHVFWVLVDEAHEPALVARYRALLDDGERERLERYQFERHRHEYLVTRALVRTTLSRYADVAPERWGFCASDHGKPAVVAPAGAAVPAFNLANTAGMCVCAVAVGAEVGVDVERLDAAAAATELAPHCLSPDEIAALGTLRPAEHRRRFLEHWTLKEAYLKARGMGLDFPLVRFGFSLDPPAPPRITIAPELDDSPDGWRFFQHRPTASHLVAAAVRSSGGPAGSTSWVVHRVRPGVDD